MAARGGIEGERSKVQTNIILYALSKWSSLWESYTLQPFWEKLRVIPSSHNWPKDWDTVQ